MQNSSAINETYQVSSTNSYNDSKGGSSEIVMQYDESHHEESPLSNMISKETPKENNAKLGKDISHLKFKLFFILLLVNALVFTIWLILKWSAFDWCFFIVQGAIINVTLLIMYRAVYAQFFNYHADILDKYSNIFSDYEKQNINNTTQEVYTFFMYICQMLVIQSVYLFAQAVKNVTKSNVIETMFDIINTALMISYILMYIGVSQSINRAFKAQYRKRLRTISKQIIMKSLNVSGGAASPKMKAVVSINAEDETVGSFKESLYNSYEA